MAPGDLTLRRHRLGPALGLGVGAYVAYMAVQHVVGPEYLGLPGNNERLFPFHLGLFVLGLAAAAGSCATAAGRGRGSTWCWASEAWWRPGASRSRPEPSPSISR